MHTRNLSAAGPRLKARPRYPALEIWREELRRGAHGQDPRRPGTWRLDALWRAAGQEQAAAEALADGLLGLHRACLEQAAAILGEALQAAA